MDRILRVVGQEKIKESPDYTIVKIEFSRVKKTYDNALEETKINIDNINKIVEQLQLNNISIKTTNFSIDRNYDYDTKKYNGYRYNQGFEFRFDKNAKLVDDILKKASEFIVTPEVSVRYVLKDAKSAKEKLIQKCVMDAKNKALVIAEASNIKLGNIIRIDYTDDEPVYEMRAISMAADEGIDGKDIEFEDSITLEYEIL